jgi:DNA-binding YbaB/EbfC family protein
MNFNPFDILKNTQKLQEQMGAIQERLGRISVSGSAGGGMVEIELNGRMEVLAVRIAPEAIADGDAEMLQDLITAAFSGALEKVKEAVNREMGAITGGFNIPGLSGLPGFPGVS